MRALPVLALALAGGLGGAALAAGPAGRVVRVEQAPGREVFVPAGSFVMGIPPDDLESLDQLCILYFQPHEPLQFPTPSGGTTTLCEWYHDELAQMSAQLDDGSPRVVTLGAYAIDRDEVSVHDYRACVRAGACSLDPLIAGDERYIRDAWPLVNVTWWEAQDYCHWRGGRLPTEAEWERAARGDDGRRWPWGIAERPGDFNHGQPRDVAMREIDRTQNLVPVQLMGDPDATDGAALLAPPGRYPWGTGPFGTRDQAGNVAEWTADMRSGRDATLGYRGLPSVNPRRDGSATEPRVVRGGSWRQPAFLARADVRDPYNMLYQPDHRFAHIGFRCARSLPAR